VIKTWELVATLVGPLDLFRLVDWAANFAKGPDGLHSGSGGNRFGSSVVRSEICNRDRIFRHELCVTPDQSAPAGRNGDWRDLQGRL
jgi:hypothetical protein